MVAFFIPAVRYVMLVLLNFRLLKPKELFQNNMLNAVMRIFAIDALRTSG